MSFFGAFATPDDALPRHALGRAFIRLHFALGVAAAAMVPITVSLVYRRFDDQAVFMWVR